MDGRVSRLLCARRTILPSIRRPLPNAHVADALRSFISMGAERRDSTGTAPEVGQVRTTRYA